MSDYPALPYGGRGLKGRQFTELSEAHRIIIVDLINRTFDKTQRYCPTGTAGFDWHARHPQAVRIWSMRPGYLCAVWKCVLCPARTSIDKNDLAPILNISLEDPAYESEEDEKCERCKRWARCEVHHWAPSAIFADAESWPKSNLCAECHDAWHAAMAKAQGRQLSEKAHASAPCFGSHCQGTRREAGSYWTSHAWGTSALD